MTDFPRSRLPAPIQATWFMVRPYGFFDAFGERFGPVFTLQIPRDPPRLVISDPGLIEEVLALPEEVFRFDTQSFPIDLGRSSILFAEGRPHSRKRRLLGPAMSGRVIRSHASAMADLADAMIDRWSAGEQRALAPELRALTLQTFVQTILGDDTPAETGPALLAWAEASLTPAAMTLAMALSPAGARALLSDTADKLAADTLPWLHRWTPWGRLARMKVALVGVLRAHIARRREAPSPSRDLLSRLLLAQDDDGAMDDDDVIAQIVTLMVGGYETTTQSLCWALHLLLHHPEALARAREEALRGEDAWINACIKEALRLRPVAPVVNRHLKEDVTLGGQAIPAGTILWPCSYRVQRDPALWKDPEAFRPERWLQQRSVPTQQYFPWGIGHRSCIGAAFATEEMRAVLRGLLRRVEMTPLDPTSRARFRGISIGLRSGCRVTIDNVRPS